MTRAEGDENVSSQQSTFYDKLYDLYIENGKAITRSILLIIFISSIVILVSTTIASTTSTKNNISVQNISLVGFQFAIPSVFILLGGLWVIAALYIYVLSLMKYNLALDHRVNNYVKTLPEANPSPGSKEVPYVDEPLISPNVVFLVVNTSRNSSETYPHRFFKHYFHAVNFVTFVIINLMWLLFPLIALYYGGSVLVTSPFPIPNLLVWITSHILWVVLIVYSVNFVLQFIMYSVHYPKNRP